MPLNNEFNNSISAVELEFNNCLIPSSTLTEVTEKAFSAATFTSPVQNFNITQIIKEGQIPNYPKWKLISEIIVEIEQDEEGSFVVSDNKFYVYGYGESQDEALQDYFISMIEYYEILEKKTDPPTKALFNNLKSFIRKNAN